MSFINAIKKYFSFFSKKNRLLNESKVFCMAPWIQLHAQTHGEVTPCCVSAYKGDCVGNLRTDANLSNAWNSAAMKQLRRNMLSGKASNMCSNCYESEALGKGSDRQQYNRDYPMYFNRVLNTLPDGTVTDNTIPLLDIRFSNKCNYKCRICNSSNSTQLYEEDLKLGKINADRPKENKVTNNKNEFWETYTALLPAATKLHFAGGEPLVMEEHYRVLEHLIAINRTNIVLSYNTNFSILRYKQYHLIDLWKKFERVEVWASLDAMGAQGDYQRKGQKWSHIEQNIRTLKQQCPHVLFGIDVTVSIFNIFSIPAFYQYMVQEQLIRPDRFNLYFLHEPDYFNITNLTSALKEQAKQLYEEFISGPLLQNADTQKLKTHATALIAFMFSEQKVKQQEFRQRVRETDALRHENFETLFPELKEMMA